MEAALIRDRVILWELRNTHPDWTITRLAEEVQRSLRWVKKWLKRFKAYPPEEHPEVFFSRSRAPHNPQRKVTETIRERVIELRDRLSEDLGRRAGPRCILYHLHRQPDLLAADLGLPTSPRTISLILLKAGRIPRRMPYQREPLEPLPPDAVWAIDFKDVATVKPDPGLSDKKQHVVEILNVVDEGTSRLIDSQARSDFRMTTTLAALFNTLLLKGMPQAIRMDRDPRYIGSWTAQEFPSPLMKFLMCLAIDIIIVPPRKPCKNPYVERFHRTLQEEFIYKHQPATLEQVLDLLEAFVQHYNGQRPNQAISCGNQPPLDAFPNLPPLPSLPDIVDPDAWVDAIHRKVYTRKVNRNGSIKLGNESYYVSRRLAGRKVTLTVNAPTQQLLVHQGRCQVNVRDIKGLHHGLVSLSDFVRMMVALAEREDRRLRLVRL